MYKIYKSGQEFLTENSDILAKYPLETVFFELNAKFIDKTDSNDFLIKIGGDDKFLMAVHKADFPIDIFGNICFCAEFAKLAVDLSFTFNRVLGAPTICEAFIAEYEKLVNCNHKINHSMDMMQCRVPVESDVSQVERAGVADVDDLAKLMSAFNDEAVGENVGLEDFKRKIYGNVGNFAVIRVNGQIVSFAEKCRETQYLTAISSVYTLPQFRCRGLSRQVVTYLTKQITDSGRLAYLFVDKKNPISNHLYQKIGYTYAVPQYEYGIIKNK